MQVRLNPRALGRGQEQIAVRILAARTAVRRDDGGLEQAAIRASGHRAARRGGLVCLLRLVADEREDGECEEKGAENAHKAADQPTASRRVERAPAQVNWPPLARRTLGRQEYRLQLLITLRDTASSDRARNCRAKRQADGRPRHALCGSAR